MALSHSIQLVHRTALEMHIEKPTDRVTDDRKATARFERETRAKETASQEELVT